MSDREELFELWKRYGSGFESDFDEGYELADAIIAAGYSKGVGLGAHAELTDEVKRAADVACFERGVAASYQVIAEWARREALKGTTEEWGIADGAFVSEMRSEAKARSYCRPQEVVVRRLVTPWVEVDLG